MDENLNHLEGVSSPSKPWDRLFLGAVLLLLGAALEPYFEMEIRLWFSASKQNSASLIAFVGALWMFLGRRKEVFGGKGLSKHLPLLFVGVFITVLWLALLMDVRSAVALFSILLLWSSLEFLFAFKRGPSTLLAGLFLLATVPIPGGVMARIGQVLVEAAATVSHALLSPFFEGLELLGYSLVLPSGTAVEVVDDCNGLAGILLFPVLGLILVAYLRVTRWKTVVLMLLLSFVAAFGGNLFRILLTAIFEFQGLSWNHSPLFHEILGLVSLAVFFLPLAWFLFRSKADRAQNGTGTQESKA